VDAAGIDAGDKIFWFNAFFGRRSRHELGLMP